MSAKENFNQAMFEMFGIGKDNNEKKTAGANMEVSRPVVKEEKKEAMKKETKPEVKAEVKETPVQPKVTYRRTVLAEGTIFEGSLTSKGDVEIGGQFKGDITTDGSVILRSDITGNIKAHNLDIIANVLTGNVQVTGNVNVAAGSQINGNITAESIVCSGKVFGDMNISGDASFDELSHVEGNITAKYITINHAYIDGKITIKK